MPAKHRPAVRTRATVYRTYRLPSQLRTGMTAKRKQLGVTVAAFWALQFDRIGAENAERPNGAAPRS